MGVMRKKKREREAAEKELSDNWFHGFQADEPHPRMTSTGSEGFCELCGHQEDWVWHNEWTRAHPYVPDPDAPRGPTQTFTLDDAIAESEFRWRMADVGKPVEMVSDGKNWHFVHKRDWLIHKWGQLDALVRRKIEGRR